MMTFIKLMTVVIGLCLLWSCYKPPSNEISEMVEMCFKNQKSIRIEFTPHPMDKNTLESEEIGK